MDLPKIAELFKNLESVIADFIALLETPYAYWYTQKGKEVDVDESNIDFVKRKLSVLDLGNPFRNSVHPAVGNVNGGRFYGGPNPTFDHSAVLRGPAWFGTNVKIRSSAKVIGPALLGDGTLLNTSSVFTRSIMGAGSQIDDLTVVKDAILGRDVYVLAGAKLLHRTRLKDEPIRVSDRRECAVGYPVASMSIDRPKMGCVIGDGCVIGANAVLGPGTILMPGCQVPSGTVLPSGIYDPAGLAVWLKRQAPDTSSRVRR